MLQSCSVTKKLEDDQALVWRVKIKAYKQQTEGDSIVLKRNRKVDKEEFEAFVRQKPNKKLFGILPFSIVAYQFFDKGKPKKFKTKLKNTLGEPPVIYNESLSVQSTKQIQTYLQTEGYYQAQTTFNTKRKGLSKKRKLKKKKIVVTYELIRNIPYLIKSYTNQIADFKIEQLVNNTSQNSKVVVGKRFDQDNITAERERIYNTMKNAGYFNFRRQYVTFLIDSNNTKRSIDIKLVISNIADSVAHKPFKINNITVEVLPISGAGFATSYSGGDTMSYNDILYISRESRFKPPVIINAIELETNKTYSAKDVEQTYSRLGALNIFKFINIRFETEEHKDTSYLNTFIELIPSKKLNARIDGEITFNSGYFGLGSNVGFTNKNIFKGAEALSVSVRGALENQRDRDKIEEIRTQSFNVRESQITSNLTFPKFFVPFNVTNFENISGEQTKFSFVFSQENRPEYFRRVVNNSYSYEWRSGKFGFFTISPISISSVSSQLSAETKADLERLNSKILLSSFDSHSTLGNSFSYNFNNQTRIAKEYSFNIKTLVQSAGLVLNTIATAADAPQNEEGVRSISGQRYYQYVRPEIEFTVYNNFYRQNTVVYRLNTGIGYAYGNSVNLPFEKQFFTGGSNSVRAWRSRTIGPGAFNQSTDSTLTNQFNLDQTGDVKIEANIEYRFDLFGPLKGALFFDAGNVWATNEDKNVPESEFRFKDFSSELALGTGLGLRIDFDFFIFRFDTGIRLRDPQFASNERWVVENLFDNNFTNQNGVKYRFINANFGIGYPF
jgi:outer membrane protein assembly factor BamA